MDSRDPVHRFITQAVDPGNAQPIIVGTSQMAEVASVDQVQELNFQTQTNATAFPLLPPGDTFVISTRNPMWAQLVYGPNAANTPYTYQVQFSVGGQNSIQYPITAISEPVAAQDSNVHVSLPITSLFPNTAFRPHGGAYYAAQYCGRSYFWVDATSDKAATVVATFTANAYANGEAVNITLNAYDLDSSRDIPDIIASDNITFFGIGTFTLTLNLAKRAYYTFDMDLTVKGNAVASEAVLVTLVAMKVNFPGIDYVAHLPTPGLAGFITLASDVRVTAASILATNVSAVLYQSGDVYMAQIPGDRPWDDVLFNGGDTVQVITSSLPRFRWGVFKWESGAYAYLKPGAGEVTLSKSPMQTDWSRGGQITISTAFAPYTTEEYLLCYVRSSSVAAAASVLGRFQMCYTVQYTSANQMIEGRRGELPPHLIQDALFQLQDQPQFFENPLHLAALATIGMRVYQAVRAIAPYARAAVSVAPYVYRAVQAGRTAYRQARQQRAGDSRLRAAPPLD